MNCSRRCSPGRNRLATGIPELTLVLPSNRDPAGKVEIMGLSGRKAAVYPVMERIQLRSGLRSSGPKLVVWSEHGKTVDARLTLPILNQNTSGK